MAIRKKLQAAGAKVFTPLGIVGSFLSLTEVVAGIAATKTTGSVQVLLTSFVCVFPILVAAAFFSILWARPHVFYPPTEFGSQQDVKAFVDAMRGKPDARNEPAVVGQQAKIEPDVPEPSKTSVADKEPEVTEPADVPSLEKAAPLTASQLDVKMTVAFIDNKLPEAEKFFRDLLVTEQDPAKRAHHTIWHAYLQYSYGDRTKGLEELRRLAAEPNTKSEATFYLGGIYERLKEFDQAIEWYQIAVDSALPSQKAGRLVTLAVAHATSGRSDSGICILSEAIHEFVEPKYRATLYQGIATIFEARKDDEMRAIALELALECDPHDTDLRFRAAYAYSTGGLHDLALFHYTAELSAKPNESGALNNLGVECQHFGMPIEAVRNYRSSLKQKHTLAGANLAYLFMNAGFEEEANKLLDELKQETNPHPNVGSAIAALAQKTESEAETKKQILNRASQEQRFLKEFGRLRLSTSVNRFAGRWADAAGETFEIVQEGNRLTANWKPGKYKKKLTGIITNGAVKVELAIDPEDIFLSGFKRLKGYAFTSNNDQTFHWMLFDGPIPEFAEFSRVVSP